jgi:hypothetical protein
VLRKFIIRASQRSDVLYRILRKLNRERVYWLSMIRRTIRAKVARRNYEIDRTLLVDPKRIKYKSLVSANKFVDAGRILPGDWDRELVPFREYIGIYDGIYDLCVREKKWYEIPFFKKVARQVQDGGIHWGCRSVADIGRRCEDIRRLFVEIRDNGYCSQMKRHRDSGDRLIKSQHDEVSVHIGRGGQFLFDDGAHRLAIAQILEVPTIPVKVVYRHPEWVAFRQVIIDFAATQGGKIYHSAAHADLQDIPAAHRDDRMDILRPHLGSGGGAALDIGAHWGYFCHHLEDLGYECYAVEMDPLHFYIMEKLKQAEGRKFRTLQMSIFDFDERWEFEVVLALNIFHHFVRTMSDHQKLVHFLGKIRTDMLFFQPHQSGEVAGERSYRDYEPEEFVKFVRRHAGLMEAELIGTAADGRQIYCLRR